jgi:hypothetical protein
MQQAVRTLTMADANAWPALHILICDRDRKWSADVRQRLWDAGLQVVLTPVRAPNANAHAERFVRSIKGECLNRLIPIGERHFRRAVAGVRRALPCRRKPPGHRQSPDLGPVGDPDDESCALSAAARRTPQFLSASAVIVRSAEKWNITGDQSEKRRLTSPTVMTRESRLVRTLQQTAAKLVGVLTREGGWFERIVRGVRHSGRTSNEPNHVCNGVQDATATPVFTAIAA